MPRPWAEQTDESVCGKHGRSRHVRWSFYICSRRGGYAAAVCQVVLIHCLHCLFTASKTLLKLKRLPVEGINFLYKMSGNVMICQVWRVFSLVLGMPRFIDSYSVFVFSGLSCVRRPGRG